MYEIKETIIMIWQCLDCYDYRVVSYSSWIPTGNNLDSQNRTGVYLFVDDSHDVKYIGRFGAGRMCFEITSAINRGRNKDAEFLKILYTNSFTNALLLEKEWITKYRPENNTNK